MRDLFCSVLTLALIEGDNMSEFYWLLLGFSLYTMYADLWSAVWSKNVYRVLNINASVRRF